MCSIEEAWAGQTFFNKQVVSQGDMRTSCMNLPNNLTSGNRSNDLNFNHPGVSNAPHNINQKFARTPRVPQMSKSVPNTADMEISSIMPYNSGYYGEEPLPNYVNFYREPTTTTSPTTTNPIPNPTTGDKFGNINNAFQESENIKKYMMNSRNDDLLNEDIPEEVMIVNNKINSKMNSKMNSKNNSNNNNTRENMVNETQFEDVLKEILNKLDVIESKLNSQKQSNMCDVTIYALLAIIILIVVYSILMHSRK